MGGPTIANTPFNIDIYIFVIIFRINVEINNITMSFIVNFCILSNFTVCKPIEPKPEIAMRCIAGRFLIQYTESNMY